MSAVTDVLPGIASLIANAGLGVTYSASGTYTTAQTGVYMLAVPTAPDRIVTLTFVAQGDDPSLPYGQAMVQVLTRGKVGDPMDCEALADSIFNLLHGSTNLQFGTTNVTQMNRRVSVPMGQDDSKRWSRADQFYLDYTVAPTTNRPFNGSW